MRFIIGSQKLVILSQFTEADKSNHRMIIKGTLRNCSYAIRGDETNEAGCLRILLRTNILNIVCQNQTSLSTDCPNKNLSNPAVRQVIMVCKYTETFVRADT